MLVRIGGHSVNPINVFTVEEIGIEVETTVKTSNSKEISGVETVPGVEITSIGSSVVQIQGVTQDQVDDLLNRYMYAQPPEPELKSKGNLSGN